jgi:hypothetical protein
MQVIGTKKQKTDERRVAHWLGYWRAWLPWQLSGFLPRPTQHTLARQKIQTSERCTIMSVDSGYGYKPRG